jgi:hypothetical protein
MQVLFYSGKAITGLALDLTRSKAYILADAYQEIITVNLDGSGATSVPAAVVSPQGIALDTKNNKLYMSGETSTFITYSNVDGTGAISFDTGTQPLQLALDLIDDKVYWISEQHGILRANLNGTNKEVVSNSATSLGRGIGLDFDRDGDGIKNSIDVCYADPNKMNPGGCGCGTPDTDNDRDGLPNCLDGCLDNSRKFEVGICGCGTNDLDSNSNLVTDCLKEDAVQVRVSALNTEVTTFYKRSTSRKRQQVNTALKRLETAVKNFPSSGTDVSKSAIQSATVKAAEDVRSLVLVHAFRVSQGKFTRASKKATKSIGELYSLVATAR